MALTDASAPAEPHSNLWLKLAKAERPFKEVPFPRTDPATGEPIGTLAMWPLTQGEIMSAQSKALLFAEELVSKSPELKARIESSPVFNNACACEILFLACRRIEDPRLPVWPTVKEIRDRQRGLSTDECAVLMQTYNIVQKELGPIASELSDVEREALIKRLQEGGSAVPLASFSLGLLIDLIMYSASQLFILRTHKCSVGWQQEELISTENAPQE